MSGEDVYKTSYRARAKNGNALHLGSDAVWRKGSYQGIASALP
jgi:hypothetical protein